MFIFILTLLLQMVSDVDKTLMKKYFTLLYYRKLYFTTENFTTWKVFFSTKLEQIKIPLSIRKLTLFFIFILIDVLDYE